MSSDAVIAVARLGKKYALRHEAGPRYLALRDEIAGLFRRKRATREEFWALRDVDLHVAEGERVGIIGRNGAGKSTLLKILSRITEPTEGSVRLRGRVASMLEVGTGFHPELTGRENIFLNGAILGMRRGEITRKFDEIVAFAGVEKFLDTPIKHFSSGMYLRLAFAVAAHLSPDVLVVDEVLAVGDAEFQRKCLGKMEEAGREGRTVLFVSHNLSALASLCTRAVLLDKGRVVSEGAVQDQLELYQRMIRRPDTSLRSTIDLGSLRLERFELSPNPVDSCMPARFAVTLGAAGEARTIEALTIFFTSSIGVRVAVIDLRSPSAYALGPGRPLVIEGTLPAVPLVEGEYAVGLFVRSGAEQSERAELLSLRVNARPARPGVVPFAARVRGLVELQAQFTVAA